MMNPRYVGVGAEFIETPKHVTNDEFTRASDNLKKYLDSKGIDEVMFDAYEDLNLSKREKVKLSRKGDGINYKGNIDTKSLGGVIVALTAGKRFLKP